MIPNLPVVLSKEMITLLKLKHPEYTFYSMYFDALEIRGKIGRFESCFYTEVHTFPINGMYVSVTERLSRYNLVYPLYTDAMELYDFNLLITGPILRDGPQTYKLIKSIFSML